MSRIRLRLLLTWLRARHGVPLTVRERYQGGITVRWTVTAARHRVCTFSGTHTAAHRELPRLVPESLTRTRC